MHICTTKNIPGYPEYRITNSGTIYGIHGRIIRPYLEGGKTLQIRLRSKSTHRRCNLGIGRLVLHAFVRDPMENEICWHIDRNPLNNHPTNLMWFDKGEAWRFENHFPEKPWENFPPPRAKLTTPFIDRLRVFDRIWGINRHRVAKYLKISKNSLLSILSYKRRTR